MSRPSGTTNNCHMSCTFLTSKRTQPHAVKQWNALPSNRRPSFLSRAAPERAWSQIVPDAAAALEPGLYIVSTPIGNLQDITIRALNVLTAADVVLAEDTRHSRKLLSAFGINTPLTSFHAFNEKQKQDAVVERLAAGQAVALISDAGTPGISDPGSMLIAAAITGGHKVIPVPGPSALLAAVVASGLPTTSFHFHGFLPPKAGSRRKELQGLRAVPATLVFYAPPHGLTAVLQDVVEVMGPGRRCCIARELTKVHEEFVRGTTLEVLQQFTAKEPRGEFVIVLEGCPDGGEFGEVTGNEEEAAASLAKKLLQEGMSLSRVAKVMAQQLRIPKNQAYSIAFQVQQGQEGAAFVADNFAGSEGGN